jgi:gas vesicle protein
MAQMDMKQAAGFLLAGALVGAAVALLYAPQSGAQTTNNIKKFAKTAVDRLDDLQGDVLEKVAGWVDDVAGAVKDGVDRGKKAGTEG